MYCRNCGKELDDNIKFCPECGASTGDYEIKKEQENMNYDRPKKGKGIASMVLGIIAVYFGFSILASATYYEDFGFAFATGYVLIPAVLSIISNCLGVSERKNNKNGFNLAGLVLSYVTYGLSFITFVIVA